MTTALLQATTTLPAALDKVDGSAFGMKKAMALIVLVSLAILVVWYYVDKARTRNKPPATPVYPILRQPHDGEHPQGPSQR